MAVLGLFIGTGRWLVEMRNRSAAFRIRAYEFAYTYRGRFLVLVKTFKGPSAASKAGELAYEYRYHHGLPSYVLVVSELRRSNLLAKQRNASAGSAVEEVVVLIGDCKTLAESKAILKQVRTIKSNTIASLTGKLRPVRTVNPYVPATMTTK